MALDVGSSDDVTGAWGGLVDAFFCSSGSFEGGRRTDVPVLLIGRDSLLVPHFKMMTVKSSVDVVEALPRMIASTVKQKVHTLHVVIILRLCAGLRVTPLNRLVEISNDTVFCIVLVYYIDTSTAEE